MFLFQKGAQRSQHGWKRDCVVLVSWRKLDLNLGFYINYINVWLSLIYGKLKTLGHWQEGIAFGLTVFIKSSQIFSSLAPCFCSYLLDRFNQDVTMGINFLLTLSILYGYPKSNSVSTNPKYFSYLPLKSFNSTDFYYYFFKMVVAGVLI